MADTKSFRIEDEMLLDEAFSVVLKKLGKQKFVRFLKLTYPGKGDFSQEREEILNKFELSQLFNELSEIGD